VAEGIDSVMSVGDAPDISADCGVTENKFPCIGKCCDMSITTVGTAYQNICDCCDAWTSLPDGVSLEVATIFECSRYGYGRRVKE
jgi:hypothetical protein